MLEMSAVPLGVRLKYELPTVEPSEIIATLMTSPSLAPTWNDTVLVVVEQADAVELRGGADALDLGGELSDLGLDGRLVAALSVPFLNWTASSRTRWSIE